MLDEIEKEAEIYLNGEKLDVLPKLFTPRQELFIEAFNGDAVEAAKEAGYKVPKKQARRLMSNPRIVAAIKARGKLPKTKIANREDRQRFWTRAMESDEYDIKDRLRASELLGKSEGDFIDRIALGGDKKNDHPIAIILNEINGTTRGVKLP